MEPWMIGGIIGGAAGGLVVLLIGLLSPPKNCPECGTPAPKVRTPANRRQMLWGGWTCPECGTELDRKGRRVKE